MGVCDLAIVHILYIFFDTMSWVDYRDMHSCTYESSVSKSVYNKCMHACIVWIYLMYSEVSYFLYHAGVFTMIINF